MTRFLVTTALEETWRGNEPTLFLGEWCQRYSRMERWSKMDAEVLPYHWDNRVKLHGDYLYIQNFYERLLQDLSKQLNHIHAVDHGLRYWRILIGPWLGCFTQILFDRWTSIQNATIQYDLTGTVVLTGQEKTLVPNSMADFSRLYASDEWNHHVYAVILEQFTEVPLIKLSRQNSIGPPGSAPYTISLKRRTGRILAAWYANAASALTRDMDAFFLSTCLPLRDEMRLHLRMGQVPQLWRTVPPVRVDANSHERQWTVNGENRSEFESCARTLIPQQIPIAYLEGYNQLVKQTGNLRWPKHPKVIFTSNSHSADDVFKAWAAQKVELGVPLVIGQHGGHYGVGRWSFAEDHDTAISDYYLSWGWADPARPNIIPVGQLKSRRPSGVRHSSQPGALLVITAVPRFSYWMYSIFVSRQYLDYFSDQRVFIAALPTSIRNQLTVRLYHDDYGWDQATRWRDKFPNLRLDDGQSSINDLVRQSRIYISTYNATTFLESFTMNVPTVMYWNPNHSELRDSAIPYFDNLKSVGIFHDTPTSAARHVAAIWDNVDAWWSSPAVQGVLKLFKTRYCHLPDDLMSKVETALRDAIAVSGKTTGTR